MQQEIAAELSTTGKRRELALALYREHRDPLFRFARLLVLDEALADEVVRAACIKVSGGRDDDVAEALKAAVLAAARDAKPSKSRRSRSGNACAVDLRDPAPRVFEALASVSGRQRECVVLRHYAGATESQIAHLIGCSIGSVRTHYRRGMAQLMGALVDLTEARA